MIFFHSNGFDIQPWRSLSRISSKIFRKLEFLPPCFHLSCVHRPFPGDLAINYFDFGMNSTLNRQTGNGRWGAVCGSGLAASALCVNIIYAPVTPCQPYPAHPDRDKATFWKKPRWVLYSLLKSSLCWGCLPRRHLTWRPILRGSRWSQAPKIFCCHAGPRIENFVCKQKTSLSLILSVWICYLRRKRGNQGAGWRTLTIAVWLTSHNFRDLEILSSGEKQQNSKKTYSMFQ